MRHFLRSFLAAMALLAALPALAQAGHGLLDHPAPLVPSSPQPNNGFRAEGGQWELLGSIPTGNPHTDLDFFTRNGETFASVGTLATAPNRGGQTIVQLTTGGEVKGFKVTGSAPTATCVSSPAETLGLQHDVEASPKGKAVLNTFNPFVDARDAQIIVDATDAPGRCHDQGAGGIANAPQGGLEIIDVTDPANPVTIGLTSHVGEAHTVNIDPKRPHIAYVSSSDQVGVDEKGVRNNETSTSSTNLDGIEMVDMRSCMNFPAGTSVEAKRMACRPQVFRYRYPSASIGLGHTKRTNIFGCHELEIYPNDRLTCAAGTALITLDMAGAFDDRGTPDDYTDDTMRGTPLPCRLRDSSSNRLAVPGSPSFFTAAKVLDCVQGGENGTVNLRVSGWRDIGSPSIEGVRYLGSVHHQGGTDQANPDADLPPTEDIIFDHEAELSQSGNLLIASDERGGGALPPGASCAQGNANPLGNGGLSFYRSDRLSQSVPANAAEAHKAYARTPEGGKAIYRAPVRTGAQALICTAHVFQQIPGQNRIFMGWYSQGTQVIDFTENRDGTVTLKEVGSFIPASANQWVSHVFKVQENANGTFTYWGAAADLRLGDGGRNTIDIYKVTLPGPPRPAAGPGVLPERLRGRTVTDPQTGQRVNADTGAGAPSCQPSRAIRSASVRQRGSRISFAFRATGRATIDVFQQSAGSRVVGERLVKRFRNVKAGSLRWNGRDRRGNRLRNGYYVARFAVKNAAGFTEYRRVPLVRRGGRLRQIPAYSGQDTCSLVRTFKLERPVFGGRSNRALNIAFRLGDEARGTVTVTRSGKVLKTFPERSYRGGQIHRLRLTAKRTRFPRGRYVVTLNVRTAGGRDARRVLAVPLPPLGGRGRGGPWQS
jgi:hypothetical protein